MTTYVKDKCVRYQNCASYTWIVSHIGENDFSEMDHETEVHFDNPTTEVNYS